MSRFIGIDLGTTYSVVAYINANGVPEIIPNDFGKPITPSVVYLGEEETLVGDAAKEKQAAGAQEVASFFKRNMGNSGLILSFHGRDYTPTDLSALVLAYLKKQAENFFGEPVTDAVITVPAYFAHAQRTATIEAGQKAGLNVMKLISEPTAAALAYGMRPKQQTQKALVYDLGGGTFDISLVEITPTELHVKATDGDHTLGGKDWDERLIKYLASQFEQEFGIELPGDDVNELRVQAEQLKFALSAKQSASVRVQAQGYTGTYTLTRQQFESLTDDLMERTRRLTEQVIEESHLSWSSLDGILPVGGSTRMPVVKGYIERMSGKAPMGGINVDEAVAMGAAIQAAMEVQTSIPMLRGSKTTFDVIAHSLGLIAESTDRSCYINSIIIPKNKEIPAAETRPYRSITRRDNTSELEVFLTQGETDDPQLCSYLGCYVFSDFPASVGGKMVTLDITYEYDKNGTVHVSAIETSTRQPLKLTIRPVPSDVPARFLDRPVSNVEQQRGGAGRLRQRPISNVPLSFDEHGNPTGHEFDLGGGDEDRVSGEKILLYTFVSMDSRLQQVIAERNLHMDIRSAPAYGSCDLNEKLLSEYSQLWYISSDRPTLSSQQVQMIARYVRAGNGLAIWADNDPYYADANLLAQALIGTSFSGYKQADRVMVPGPELEPGRFIEHPLTQGVNNLYEGITICTIAPTPNVTILGQSHDEQLCVGCFERENQRIVLDTGFTKLYTGYFEKSAGISRYLCNIAFWLARGRRGVEYRLLTPSRENMATINPDKISEEYKSTIIEPTSLTYILQWHGSATLGLTVREPRGSVVRDEFSSDGLLRINLRADTMGDWICQVRGVKVPSLNFPYVLTLVLER